jgi:hypothetical protein
MKTPRQVWGDRHAAMRGRDDMLNVCVSKVGAIASLFHHERQPPKISVATRVMATGQEFHIIDWTEESRNGISITVRLSGAVAQMA